MLYADEICLFAPSINSLKYLIFRIEVKKLKLTINCKKLVCIKFLTIKNLVCISTVLNLKMSI